jgi:hypothetical protein
MSEPLVTFIAAILQIVDSIIGQTADFRTDFYNRSPKSKPPPEKKARNTANFLLRLLATGYSSLQLRYFDIRLAGGFGDAVSGAAGEHQVLRSGQVNLIADADE